MGRIISQEKEYSGITLSQQSLPIGAVVPYMGTTAPSGFLACDGTVYNISSYPLLAGFIEAQKGSINYFGGDGATTFAVPDLRGEFLRGAGTNGHTNQGNGAAVGVHQDGTKHVRYQIANGNKIYGAKDETDSENRDYDNRSSGQNFTSAMTSVASSNMLQTFTSRPTNTSVLYIIKATPDRLDKITFAEVDDTSVSSDAVWSAEKIKNYVDTKVEGVILDYSNKVDLRSILNGVNKTYTPTKNGICMFTAVSTSTAIDFCVSHNGIRERQYVNNQGNGFLPVYLNFPVNANEELKVMYFVNVSLDQAYFIPYKY